MCHVGIDRSRRTSGLESLDSSSKFEPRQISKSKKCVRQRSKTSHQVSDAGLVWPVFRCLSNEFRNVRVREDDSPVAWTKLSLQFGGRHGLAALEQRDQVTGIKKDPRTVSSDEPHRTCKRCDISV